MKEERILYEYFKEKLFELADKGKNIISHKRIRWVLARYRIPSQLHCIIIKVMLDEKMLKEFNPYKNSMNYSVEFNGDSIMNHLGEYYEAAGFWDGIKEKEEVKPIKNL